MEVPSQSQTPEAQKPIDTWNRMRPVEQLQEFVLNRMNRPDLDAVEL